MICANQMMLRETLAFLKDEPPVIVDWLPWNHTFGGNHNVGLTLYNGGSMYLDEGKPTPGGIEETVQNLREISPTVYFQTCPRVTNRCCPICATTQLCGPNSSAGCTRCSSRAPRCRRSSGTASDALAVQETGYRVPMLTGLGATETSPFFHVGAPPTPAVRAMSGYRSRAMTPSLCLIMASWRSAPGGRTSRPATGGQPELTPKRSTRKAFTSSAMR